MEFKTKDGRLMLPIARGPMWFYFAICLGFFVIGAVAIGAGKVEGWFVAIFFGFGTVVTGIGLIPGSSYLELTPQGFVGCVLFRKRFYAWETIDTFRVGRLGKRPAVVLFDMAPGFQRTKAQIVSRKLSGCDGALSTDCGVNPHYLANLMNEWRERATSSSQGR